MSYVVLAKNYDLRVISVISPSLGQSQANFLAFGLAWDFTKSEPPKARPKLGLSGQARASTSLSRCPQRLQSSRGLDGLDISRLGIIGLD